MEAFVCQVTSQSICSLLAPNSYPLVQYQGLKDTKMKKMSQGGRLVQGRNGDNGLIVVGCAKWNMEGELKRELEEEMKKEEEEMGVMMGRFRHKCEEEKGLVEMLDCLEREAIMGEDVGKEPSDYNRRAHIFDTSSRVIQALKQHDSSSSSVSPQHTSN